MLNPAPIFKMPRAAQLLLAICIGVFAFVFTMQYGFDYQPCVLCLWERLPYAIAGLAALAAWAWKPYGKQTPAFLSLAALAFFCDAGLSIFHTGVERHWWLGTRGCSLPHIDAKSLDDLREQILKAPPARCDQIAWTFLGLSIANWNVPASFAFGIFAAIAARKAKS